MWNPVWESIFQEKEWGRYPSEDLIRFVARNFYAAPKREHVRILEVGCGPGANLWYLAREGFSFYGIDGSPTAVSSAQQRLDSECPGWRNRGELVVGDISALPYEDTCFNAVIDNEAISCNGFREACLMYGEINRVLLPGGKLYSRTFADGSWGDKTGIQVGPGTWLCEEGPLVDKGPCRFTQKSEIPVLLSPLKIETTELLKWTCDNMTKEIREWLITGTKSAQAVR
jgi:SAM-dependent methyltransferase